MGLTINDKKVAEHYNYPAEFYSLYLGEYMNYSCAKWGPCVMTQDQAAVNKWMYFATVLDLNKSDRLLDIGCGWGMGLRYLQKKYKCKATGLNVSDEQLVWARKKTDAVAYITSSWDTHHRFEYYTKIIVDGCLVHQKERQKEFFGHLYKLLVPGGILLVKEVHFNKVDALTIEECGYLNQTFGDTGEYRRLEQDVMDAEDAGFTVETEDFGISNYIKTTNVWIEEMEKNMEALCTLSAEKADLDRRTWIRFNELFRKDIFSIELMVCKK